MDNLTKAGATALALRVADYWHRRGFRHFECAVVPLGINGHDGHYTYGIRSNLDAAGNPPKRPTPINGDMELAA